MSRVILDIETVGRDFESLESPVQDYLLRFAESDEEQREVRESLGLYPLFAEIVTIGMLNPETGKGTVLFQNNSNPILPFDEDGLRYETGTEEEILSRFWETVKGFNQIVTFNGRGFDCPFILVRSAVRRIRPSKDLMPNRYYDSHIDLLDQLTFYGALRRRFSLDMWCRAFGIRSPKADGVSGSDVARLYRDAQYLEIARYCGQDLHATAELLAVWEQYMKFQPRSRDHHT